MCLKKEEKAALTDMWFVLHTIYTMTGNKLKFFIFTHDQIYFILYRVLASSEALDLN